MSGVVRYSMRLDWSPSHGTMPTTLGTLQGATDFSRFGVAAAFTAKVPARKTDAKPPATLAAGKRAFYQQMDLSLEKAYELAGQVIASSFAHQEGREGMDAFIDKRPPNWK